MRRCGMGGRGRFPFISSTSPFRSSTSLCSKGSGRSRSSLSGETHVLSETSQQMGGLAMGDHAWLSPTRKILGVVMLLVSAVLLGIYELAVTAASRGAPVAPYSVLCSL